MKKYNDRKLRVRRAMALAVLAMLAICTVAVVPSDSDASPTSSLKVSSNGDSDPVYTMSLTTGQSFTYSGLVTPLDGLDNIRYTWMGDAVDTSGSNGIAWDPDAKELSGTFAKPGQRTGIMQVTADDPYKDGGKVSCRITFQFDINESMDIDPSVATYVKIGESTGKVIHTISSCGDRLLSMDGYKGTAFVLERNGEDVILKTGRDINSSDVGSHTMTIRLTDPSTGDVAKQEVIVNVFDGPVITNDRLHIFTDTDGTGLDTEYVFDLVSPLGSTVVMEGVLLSDTDGPLSASDSRLVIDRHSLVPGDFRATYFVETSDGGRAEVVFTLTVVEKRDMTITLKPISNGSHMMILSVTTSVGDCVTADWGDGVLTEVHLDGKGDGNTARSYSSKGMYLMTVTSESADSVRSSKVMVSVGSEPQVAGGEYASQFGGDSDDGRGWLYILFAIIAIVSVVLYFLVLPVIPLIFVAVLSGILSVVTYIW